MVDRKLEVGPWMKLAVTPCVIGTGYVRLDASGHALSSTEVRCTSRCRCQIEFTARGGLDSGMFEGDD